MSDIMERLLSSPLGGLLEPVLRHEARAEIERLTADRDQWKSLARLSEEQNERLRIIAADYHALQQRATEIDDQNTWLRTEIEAWRECAKYDPMMSGEARFKGWDRSALDRCRKKFIEAGALEGKK